MHPSLTPDIGRNTKKAMAESFDIFGLPTELRAMILRHAILPQFCLTVWAIRPSPEISPANPDPDPVPWTLYRSEGEQAVHNANLTTFAKLRLVNKQLSAETEDVFYKNASLEIVQEEEGEFQFCRRVPHTTLKWFRRIVILRQEEPEMLGPSLRGALALPEQFATIVRPYGTRGWGYRWEFNEIDPQVSYDLANHRNTFILRYTDVGWVEMSGVDLSHEINELTQSWVMRLEYVMGRMLVGRGLQETVLARILDLMLSPSKHDDVCRTIELNGEELFINDWMFELERWNQKLGGEIGCGFIWCRA